MPALELDRHRRKAARIVRGHHPGGHLGRGDHCDAPNRYRLRWSIVDRHWVLKAGWSPLGAADRSAWTRGPGAAPRTFAFGHRAARARRLRSIPGADQVGNLQAVTKPCIEKCHRVIPLFIKSQRETDGHKLSSKETESLRLRVVRRIEAGSIRRTWRGIWISRRVPAAGARRSTVMDTFVSVRTLAALSNEPVPWFTLP